MGAALALAVGGSLAAAEPLRVRGMRARLYRALHGTAHTRAHASPPLTPSPAPDRSWALAPGGSTCSGYVIGVGNALAPPLPPSPRRSWALAPGGLCLPTLGT